MTLGKIVNGITKFQYIIFSIKIKYQLFIIETSNTFDKNRSKSGVCSWKFSNRIPKIQYKTIAIKMLVIDFLCQKSGHLKTNVWKKIFKVSNIFKGYKIKLNKNYYKLKSLYPPEWRGTPNKTNNLPVDSWVH